MKLFLFLVNVVLAVLSLFLLIKFCADGSLTYRDIPIGVVFAASLLNSIRLFIMYIKKK